MLLDSHVANEIPMKDFPAVTNVSNAAADPQLSSDIGFPGLETSCGPFLDDFTAFMDSVPFISNPFSPSYQPLPVFSPDSTLHMPLSRGNAVSRFDPKELNPEHPSASSPFSPFGSRLPSLGPPEAPAQQVRRSLIIDDHFVVSVDCHAHFQQELEKVAGILPDRVVFPSRHTLSRFIAAYFHNFHEHYPFLHVPTFRLRCISLNLFLAIAAVGSRYSREPEVSVELFTAAKAVVLERIRHRRQAGLGEQFMEKRASDSFINGRGPSAVGSQLGKGGRGLDIMHTQLLLIAIATWFSQESETYEALSIRSTLDSIMRENTMEDQQAINPQDWYNWVQCEMAKRTKLVAFCFFNIHTIAFDLPPMMLLGEFNLDLPCSERQWKANDEVSWENTLTPHVPRQDLQEVFERLFRRGAISESNVPAGFTSLGGFALIHAIATVYGRW